MLPLSSPSDPLLLDKAIAILKCHCLSSLDSIVPYFTPQSARYLLLQCQNNQKLILKFLDWARNFPFFDNLQCKYIAIHILTCFKLYRTAQSLTEGVAVYFSDDENGISLFECLRKSYHLGNLSSKLALDPGLGIGLKIGG